MRAGEQTGRHLLLAVITTVFSGMLGLITAVMAWEFWVDQTPACTISRWVSPSVLEFDVWS